MSEKSNYQHNKKITDMKAITIIKQTKLFVVAIVCCMVSNPCLADDRPIPVEQLPAAAKTFVQENFKGKKILYAEKDWGTYECRLDDGTKIDFHKDGTWDKIDCNMSAVPDSTVPAPIMNYVKANFPGAAITKIDKERYGYEIELSNDMDLKFDRQGALIGMDD